MRILVTGVAGFVGSHIAQALVKDGHQVVGVDSLIPIPYAVEQKLETLASLRGVIEFYEIDLRVAALEPYVKGIDVVVHSAGMAGLLPSWEHIDVYLSCNVTATARLARAAIDFGVGRFIHLSSSSVYGGAYSAIETYIGQPLSPYGVTKKAAEDILRVYERTFGLPLTILRLFTVYGPGQRADMAFNRFIDAVLLNQPVMITQPLNSLRSATYIDDCVTGIKLATYQDCVGSTFNLAGASAVSLREVLHAIAEATGRQPILALGAERAGDQPASIADISRARSEIGFRPAVSLVEGIQRQVSWQRHRMTNSVA